MSSHIKVLLAEDESSLGMIVKESLESRGFKVILCENGEEALKYYEKDNIDILVLDVMMPKLDGYSVAQRIRKSNPSIPIIFLTAKSRTEDVVEGFSYGANDYIKKPFSMEELIVRINALLTKIQPELKEEWIQIGKYQFHFNKQVLKHQNIKHSLTSREAQLLRLLYINHNKLTERSIILNDLWGNDDFFNARSMDVFISKLRKKLQEDPEVQILNVRGYGYKLLC